MPLFHFHNDKEGPMTQPDPNDPNVVATQAEQQAQQTGGPTVPGATDATQPFEPATQPETDNRDELITALSARLDQVQAQLAQQASQQAAAKAAGDGQPQRIDLKSGKYEPNNTATLTVWNYGDPVPDGFSPVTTSDGSKLAVKLQPNGDPVRDEYGNAYSVHEGSAVVQYGDGRYEHLSAEDANAFGQRYAKAGS